MDDTNKNFPSKKVYKLMIKFWSKSKHPEAKEIVQSFKDAIREIDENIRLEQDYLKEMKEAA